MNITKYYINGIQLYPIKNSITAATYYGFTNGSSNLPLTESKKILVYLYEDTTTNKLSLNFVIDKYLAGNTGSANILVSNLPVSSIITLSDDANESSKINDTTVSGIFVWGNNTDGMVIDNIQDFTSVTINLTSFTTINGWKINTSGNDCTYLSLNTNILTLTKVVETFSGYLNLEPSPGIYTSTQTINITKSSDVKNIIYTTNGTAPTLAKYIAYDNLTPSNPFIAVVQDGKGNVVFDGGFPKFYNSAWGSWTSYNQMTDTFKYFGNILNFISNKNKVNSGNKKVLFIGDAPSGSYQVTATTTNGFKTSIQGICNIMGYTPTIVQSNSYSNNLISIPYSTLDQYCAVCFFGTISGSTRYITEETVQNLVAYRESGNGIFLITDHGSGSTGFYYNANFIANQFGAYFEGDYNRSPVNVGWLIDTYGEHPLWENMLRSSSIYAGGSESRVFITTYPTYTTPPQVTFSTSGYHSLRYLLELNDGNIITESYTYGIGTNELIYFKDENNNTITSVNTVLNNLNITFDIQLDSFSSASGIIKKNNEVLGEFNKTTSGLTINWYSGNNNKSILNGDNITLQINSPLFYAKSLIINRLDFETLINDKILSLILKNIKKYELNNVDKVDYKNEIEAILNLSKEKHMSLFVKKLKQYLET